MNNNKMNSIYPGHEISGGQSLEEVHNGDIISQLSNERVSGYP